MTPRSRPLSPAQAPAPSTSRSHHPRGHVGHLGRRSVHLHCGRRPTVTGINPTTGPAAGGTLVTITGTSFTGATAVQLRRHAGDGRHRRQRHHDHGHSAPQAPAPSTSRSSPPGARRPPRPPISSPTSRPSRRRSRHQPDHSGPTAGGTLVTITGDHLHRRHGRRLRRARRRRASPSSMTPRSRPLAPQAPAPSTSRSSPPGARRPLRPPISSRTSRLAPTVTGINPNTVRRPAVLPSRSPAPASPTPPAVNFGTTAATGLACSTTPRSRPTAPPARAQSTSLSSPRRHVAHLGRRSVHLPRLIWRAIQANQNGIAPGDLQPRARRLFDASRFPAPETGTQLVIDSSCVPVSALEPRSRGVAGADRREAPGPKPVHLGRRLRLAPPATRILAVLEWWSSARSLQNETSC